MKTKNKINKGLLKRVRVTGTGRVKMHRAGNRHLRSHKSANAIRGYRLTDLASKPDMMKLRRMLLLKKTKPRFAERIAEAACADSSAVQTTPAPPPIESPVRPRKTRDRASSAMGILPVGSAIADHEYPGPLPADER